VHFNLLSFNLQYARETESMLAQQRKENRSNMFALCPHVQVIIVFCYFFIMLYICAVLKTMYFQAIRPFS